MGQRSRAMWDQARAARSRLRTRTLPTLTAVLLLQISIATARPGYDLRALSSAFGLVVLLVLGLVAATVDALATFAVMAMREAARTRVRFGPAAPLVVAAPRPITADLLLDKRGRSLRGAARVARIAAIERERAQLAPVAAASAFRVIELPALPDLRTHPATRYARSLLAAAYARSLPLLRYLRSLSIPSVRIPVPSLSMRGLRIVAITTTMTFVFATAIGTTGFIAQRGTIALGASTTLTIISGEVSVRGSETEPFQRVADGAFLRAGMTIQTGPNTYAVLTYFEGSTVSIEPGTTLAIDALESHPDGSTVISMQQQIGRTWHSVTKLLHQGSKYEVRTPTATATVRGTAFEVGVEQDPATGEITSSVITTEGAVGAAKPSTPADPAPIEVVVPAGFQTTAKGAEPVAPPEPAPEPERKVTVTVGAPNALVIDPLGRANGEKDGKLVLQTPGAKVQKIDGKLVVTLPKIPDGKISTVITRTTAPTTVPEATPPAPVSVVTVVAERGRGESRTEETVQLPAPTTSGPVAPIVTGVEIKRSDAGRPVELRQLDQTEKQSAPAPKLPDPPKPEQRSAGPDKKGDEADRGKSEAGDAGKAGGVTGAITRSTLPPVSAQESAKRDEELRKTVEKAKEEAAKRDDERRKDAEKRGEELRKAEAKAKEEAAKLGEERRKAEEKAREEAAKREEERRRAAESAQEGAVRREADRAREAPAPQGVAGVIENIFRTVVAAGPDETAKRDEEARKEAAKRDEEARKEAEKRSEELRKAEEKAKEGAAKLGDERRTVEERSRNQEIRREEERRKDAEKRAEEHRKAEEKAKEEAPKERQKIREIEEKAREQAQKLEEGKRREAEKRLDDFRNAEEKAREEAAKRVEEQRKAEERAKEGAEKRLEELRKDEEKAKEETAKRDEEKKRDDDKRSSDGSRRFVPQVSLPPLPGFARGRSSD